jgi:glycosyltransferase involved in cell wall biosynthesis
MAQPLVSCLMVTKERAHLARRAALCFSRQTWPNKELVIIDDGSQDYEPILATHRADHTIHYHRVAPDPELRLGGLRNLALERAHGEFLVQWDDDEWYHPQRIEHQMASIDRGLDAVVLRDTLVHLDTGRYAQDLFHTRMPSSVTPGTILHRRSPIRYPNLPRGEDAAYLYEMEREHALGIAEVPHSHLFIRCFHGANTWELEHFYGAFRHGTWNRVCYYLTRYLARDLRRHPAFRLSPLEREAAAHFLTDSRELGLL